MASVKVRLRVQGGSSSSEAITLQKFPTTVGRHRECKLRITSRQVSRRHCVLEERDGRLAVRDLESSNGTFVNGQRIQGETILQPGDCLGIGPISLQVEYLPQPAEAQESVPAVPTEAASGSGADLVGVEEAAGESAGFDLVGDSTEFSLKLASSEDSVADFDVDADVEVASFVPQPPDPNSQPVPEIEEELPFLAEPDEPEEEAAGAASVGAEPENPFASPFEPARPVAPQSASTEDVPFLAVDDVDDESTTEDAAAGASQPAGAPSPSEEDDNFFLTMGTPSPAKEPVPSPTEPSTDEEDIPFLADVEDEVEEAKAAVPTPAAPSDDADPFLVEESDEEGEKAGVPDDSKAKSTPAATKDEDEDFPFLSALTDEPEEPGESSPFDDEPLFGPPK